MQQPLGPKKAGSWGFNDDLVASQFFPLLKEGFSLMNCGTPHLTCETFSLHYHRGSSSSFRIVSSGIYGDLIGFHGDFVGISLGFHGNLRFFEIPSGVINHG